MVKKSQHLAMLALQLMRFLSVELAIDDTHSPVKQS
jgi:hypothetical protein